MTGMAVSLALMVVTKEGIISGPKNLEHIPDFKVRLSNKKLLSSSPGL
jgi:predicted ATP-dependent serine protease